MTDEQFAEFFGAYITCALWSSHDHADDSGGEPLDANYDESDLTLGCRNAMRCDCASFVADCANDLAGLDPEQCGHDFWLTRNGHGAGFWDRGLGALGERLTRAAKSHGSVDLYVNDDGKVDA
jgi:hypothetical protein